MANFRIQDLPMANELAASELRNLRGGVIGDFGYPGLSWAKSLPVPLPSTSTTASRLIQPSVLTSQWNQIGLCSVIPTPIPVKD